MEILRRIAALRDVLPSQPTMQTTEPELAFLSAQGIHTEPQSQESASLPRTAQVDSLLTTSLNYVCLNVQPPKQHTLTTIPKGAFEDALLVALLTIQPTNALDSVHPRPHTSGTKRGA